MFVKDVFAFKLSRINLGLKDYAGLEKISQFMGLPPFFTIITDVFFPQTGHLKSSLTVIKLPSGLNKNLQSS